MAAWDKAPLASGKQPAWADAPLANVPAFKPTGPGAISVESDQRAVDNEGGAMAVGRNLYRQARDFGAGAIRGAGSIGATLLGGEDVRDIQIKVVNGKLVRGPNLAAQRDAKRRAAMTAALGKLGADTNSTQFGVGKIAGEIAGTAGAGEVLAAGAATIPGVARYAPALVDAIGSGGMTAGGRPFLGSIPARVIGGATSGGGQAGLADPSQAGTGAVIGGALPVAVGAAGVAGRMLRGTEQTPELQQAIAAARQHGYVIPPTQARPTFFNRAMEGFSGKLTTAQNASARNQRVTNRLAAQTIGLPADTVITPQVLTAVRNQAGQAYQRISGIGQITTGAAYNRALDRIAAPAHLASAGFPNAPPSPVIQLVESLRANDFDAASGVAMIRSLRDQADQAFASGNTELGRAARAGATAIEGEIDRQLNRLGNRALLAEYRQARQRIAQTYSIERALNKETGTVDAKKLAAQLDRNRPLSGGLRDAARFSARFKTASQTPEQMGSLPQISPLDAAAALIGVGGVGGGVALGSTGLSVPAAALMFGRPAVRAGLLSGPIQNRLIQPAARTGATSNALTQGLSRSAIPAYLNRPGQ